MIGWVALNNATLGLWYLVAVVIGLSASLVIAAVARRRRPGSVHTLSRSTSVDVAAVAA